MMNSGQVSDPGPLLDTCDPEECTHRVGGEHGRRCGLEEDLRPEPLGSRIDRLPHCTPNAWMDHSLLCDRDGTFCSKASTHSGPCVPHGSPIPESEQRALWGDR